MLFYVIPFLFLSTVCFGMEQASLQSMLNDSNRRDIWESAFKNALVYADCNLLNELVRSPHFTSEYVIATIDSDNRMIDPISFCLLYSKKDARKNVPACIKILYNNGIPLILPEAISEDYSSPFMLVKNAKEFQCLLKLCVQKKEKIIDWCSPKKIGKEILEIDFGGNFSMYFHFILGSMNSSSLITLYNEYKPDILDKKNLLTIAYLEFGYTSTISYAVKNNIGNFNTDTLKEIESDPDFIKNIIPFFLKNGAGMYQKDSLDDIKNYLLQIIKKDTAVLRITSSPVLHFLSNSIRTSCDLLLSDGIDLKPLIDGIEKLIPSEEELIEDAVRLALNVEANQSKTLSLRDVILKKKKSSNVLQALIARQYKI